MKTRLVLTICPSIPTKTGAQTSLIKDIFESAIWVESAKDLHKPLQISQRLNFFKIMFLAGFFKLKYLAIV